MADHYFSSGIFYHGYHSKRMIQELPGVRSVQGPEKTLANGSHTTFRETL